MTLLGEYLLEMNMGQGEFSVASGVEPSMVSHYVNGNRKPGLENALAIERATGGRVPATYWIEFKPRRRRTPKKRVA